ncbi:COR domain-containing protein [Enhygromyxa salina]|nr:COR domain-containing protein [Enhygromyxa salina]
MKQVSITNILEKARAEQWEELALGRDENDRQWLRTTGWNPARTFIVGGEALNIEDVVSCTGLQRLAMRHCARGSEGALALATLTGLTSLDLSENSIGDEGAQALFEGRWAGPKRPNKLRWLALQRNNITFLPKEILDTRDAQAILAYYRRYRSSANQPLNEAKLLVVGNEAVGKTSLIRYLTTGKPRDPDEKKTPGVIAHQRIETQTWCPADQAPFLNVWDFGGQEMLHETHKFFLTERSVYLLVLEDRREDDTSIYKWLRTISNRGGDSPIIVVINKCDDNLPKLLLDETTIAREWPSVVAFVRTSCNGDEVAGQTIKALKVKILETLQHDPRLAHVRDLLPNPWRRVKDAVAEFAEHQKVLSHLDFVRLCENAEAAEAITDENEQRGLLQLLHNLGVIVAHGLRQDAPAALQNVTILDPNWLTGAIYKVLTAGLVVQQSGVFRREQLAELLDSNDYPVGRWEFMLSMMQLDNMGLCFPLRGSTSEEYLVPEALPKNAPNYDSWPKDSLRFRFDYEYLPPGLIPRFIVEAHAQDTSTRWRTGVVLTVAGCSVLVAGNPGKNRLDILVHGSEAMRRSALNVVLEHLGRVHALNPEIKPAPKVPLPDNPEVTVSYQHLLTLEDLEGPTYRYLPENASRRYSVSELLDGVRTRQLKDDTKLVVSADLPSPDVLLVVTTDVEFEAVETAAKAITGQNSEILNGRRRVYYDLGTIADARVFVVETEMGASEPGGSLSSVSTAIAELRLGSSAGRAPASVIAVGTAFGMSEGKQAIGDVLVSTHLRNYDPERVGKNEIIPRGSRAPASTTLLSRVRGATKRLKDFKVRRGLVLSGAKLVDNFDYRESLERLEPEAIGGEMEGSGVHTACHDGGAEWLVVKAICDWGDGNKGDDKNARQNLAAKNAATLVFAALWNGGFKR